MPVPTFDARGLLPPFLGADAVTADRSPYFTTMSELVAAMGTTPHRRQLLRNLIAYRSLLVGDGYVSGIQFVDGSFVENVEAIAGRQPSDIDVLSILRLPDKYKANDTLWQSAGMTFWLSEISDNPKNKSRFSLDTYAVLIEELGAAGLIQQTAYWYGLFSHQRSTFAWKGFVALPLAQADDQAALASLGIT